MCTVADIRQCAQLRIFNSHDDPESQQEFAMVRDMLVDMVHLERISIYHF
jgi:hypothetical protein